MKVLTKSDTYFEIKGDLTDSKFQILVLNTTEQGDMYCPVAYMNVYMHI